MQEETIVIGMIKAAQAEDEAGMNEMLKASAEAGLRPENLLACMLGFLLGLLSYMEDEGHPTQRLLQDLALSILTEEP